MDPTTQAWSSTSPGWSRYLGLGLGDGSDCDGDEFNDNFFVQVRVNLPAVKRRVESLGGRRTVKQQWQVHHRLDSTFFSH